MTREPVRRSLYLLFALACLGNGVWLLIDPASWNELLRMQAEDYGDGNVPLLLLRKMGATYLCLSLAFLWCLVDTRARRRMHPVLTLFFALTAGIHAGEILGSQSPSHRWVTDLPFVYLPPLVLVLMMLRLPRPGAGREQGRVKWFDARKGYGFIVRDNGQELFVHYRSIRPGGPRALRENERVSFRPGQGDKGPQAEDVERQPG